MHSSRFPWSRACCVWAILAPWFFAVGLLAGGRNVVDDGPDPDEWPIYTILVPLYKEIAVASKILQALQALDYPTEKLDVKILLEADDPETLAALHTAGIPSWIEVIVVPDAQPKTKPRACNHGLVAARGEFLVIYDAEDRPEPDQLKKSVRAYRQLPDHVACLQAQLAYHNYRQNILTKWFALEYNTWFRRYLPGLVRLGAPIPLGGTSFPHRGFATVTAGTRLMSLKIAIWAFVCTPVAIARGPLIRLPGKRPIVASVIGCGSAVVG